MEQVVPKSPSYHSEMHRKLRDGVYGALDLVDLIALRLRSLHGQSSESVAHVLQAKATSDTGLRLMDLFTIVVR